MILTSSFNMMDNLIWPLFINTTPPPPPTVVQTSVWTCWPITWEVWTRTHETTMFLSRLSWIRQSRPLIDFYEKIHHLVVMFWQFRVQGREPLRGKNTLKFWARTTLICSIKRGLVQETGWDYTFLLWTCLIISSINCLEYSRFLWPM